MKDLIEKPTKDVERHKYNVYTLKHMVCDAQRIFWYAQGSIMEQYKYHG